MTRIIVAVLAVGGLGTAAAWMWPAYRHMARGHQVAEVIVATEPIRKEIGYRFEQTRTLAGVGRGLEIVPKGAVTSGEVSADGVIVARGLVDGHPIEVGFKPILKPDGTLQWRCRGLKVVEGPFVPASGHFPSSCPKASAEALF